jgi:hypothetical protein
MHITKKLLKFCAVVKSCKNFLLRAVAVPRSCKKNEKERWSVLTIRIYCLNKILYKHTNMCTRIGVFVYSFSDYVLGMDNIKYCLYANRSINSIVS